MKNKEAQGAGGIGFFGLLTVVLIGLKLAKVVDIPWLWVLSPIWVPIVFGLALFLVILLVAGLFLRK